MTTIFLGGHLLQPFAESSLLPDWFGHTFLLKSTDDVVDKDDMIIRGGPKSGIGTDPLTIWNNVILKDSPDYSKSKDWKSIDNADEYFGYTALQFSPGTNLDGVWNTLVDLASQIAGCNLSYDLFRQNGNSLTNTLLEAIGFDQMPDPGGLSYWYPGRERILTSDFETSQSYTYKIKGNDTLGDIPINDRLVALDAEFQIFGEEGDYLAGFAGDDVLYDGNRKDVLEGGEANDRIVLCDDGHKDIVIVGRGHDVISGGDKNDRLVIRPGDLYIPENAPGLGALEKTTGIPLLGGFMMDPDNPSVADFVSSVSVANGQNVDNVGYVDFPMDANPPLWKEISSVFHWPGGDSMTLPYQWNDSPYFRYELHDDGSLDIYSGYSWDPVATITDFEMGDFGIHFFETVQKEAILHFFNGGDADMDRLTGGWVEDADGVDYIQNGGEYITIPEAGDPAPFATTVIGPEPRPDTDWDTADADSSSADSTAVEVVAVSDDPVANSPEPNEAASREAAPIVSGVRDGVESQAQGADVGSAGAGLDDDRGRSEYQQARADMDGMKGCSPNAIQSHEGTGGQGDRTQSTALAVQSFADAEEPSEFADAIALFSAGLPGALSGNPLDDILKGGTGLDGVAWQDRLTFGGDVDDDRSFVDSDRFRIDSILAGNDAPFANVDFAGVNKGTNSLSLVDLVAGSVNQPVRVQTDMRGAFG